MAAVSPAMTRYLAPRFMMKIEGTRVRDDFLRYVQSVEYEEGEELASKISIILSNPGFRFVDSKAFAEGNRIDLWMGYVGHPLVFQNRGIVMKPNPDFPSGGMPVYQIIAHDVTRQLMQEEARGTKFEDQRDDEMVQNILTKAGILAFRPQVKLTKGIRTRFMKRGTSPWEFIQRLNRLRGFELLVRFDPTAVGIKITTNRARRTFTRSGDGVWRGYWGPPGSLEPQTEKYTFSYGTGQPDATLLEFHPNMSLPSQATRIEIAYTDPKTRKHQRMFLEVDRARAEKTKFVGSSGTQRLRRPVGNGPSVTFTVFGQREEVIADYPFLSPASAKRLCAAWWARREREFVFARGTVLGVPTLRKGQVHGISVPSTRLSGDWIFTSVRQRQGAGETYVTEFTATKKVLQSLVASPDAPGRVRVEERSQ